MERAIDPSGSGLLARIPAVRGVAVVLILALVMASCATLGDNPKAAFGGLGGATVGGLIAAAAGGGGAGIAAGVIGGALLGGPEPGWQARPGGILPGDR
jgi:hypothetical protein